MSVLDDRERDALHEVELGVEHLHRGYGHLLAFHHSVGHAMDRLAAIEDDLRAAGHEKYAAELRDDHLPAGVGASAGATNWSRSSTPASSRR